MLLISKYSTLCVIISISVLYKYISGVIFSLVFDYAPHFNFSLDPSTVSERYQLVIGLHGVFVLAHLNEHLSLLLYFESLLVSLPVLLHCGPSLSKTLWHIIGHQSTESKEQAPFVRCEMPPATTYAKLQQDATF